MNNLKAILGLLVSVVLCAAEPPVNSYLPAARTSSQYGAPSSRFSPLSSSFGVPSARGNDQFSTYQNRRFNQYSSGSVFSNRQSGLLRPQFGLGTGPSAQYGAANRFSSAASRYSSNGFSSSNQYGNSNGGYGNLRNGNNGGSYSAGGYYNNGGYSQEDQSEPANYEFSYEVNAPQYGVELGHVESRQGDDTRGTYFVLLPDGRRQRVDYTADLSGYKPIVSYEDTDAANRGSYNGAGNGYQNGGYNSGGYQSARSGPY